MAGNSRNKIGIAALRRYIMDTLAFWKVPGAAVAIVKNGEAILCEGFGYRDVANKLSVTPNTIFPIASVSKAFTAMGVAVQVDAGRIEWHKPVRTYMPDFKLSDPVISERITPRDLLCHRSGLPRHDLVWYASNFLRQEVLDRLCHLEFNRDLRAAFQYQNMMFMAAGVLAARMDGNAMSWEEYTKARILDPLGMSRTNFSTVETQRDEDHARPYRKKKSKILTTTYFEADGGKDAVGPAGSICSCARDMLQWLLLNLNQGKHNGNQFVSQSNLIQMQTPHMLMGDYGYYPQMGLRFGSYGLGWFIHSFNGCKLVEHGGNLDGFSSQVSLMPDEGTGVAVLTNLEATFARDVLGIALHEMLLGLKSIDWNTRFKAMSDEFEKAETSGKAKSSSDRKRNAPASHPLDDFVGAYEHPGYGVVAIRRRGKQLEAVMNDKITLPVTHYHYDVFEARFEKFDYRLKLSFGADLRGNIATLAIQMEPAVKESVFTRLPPKHSVPAETLARLAGNYELVGMLVSVVLKDDALSLIIPGQPVYTLLPYAGLEFQIKERAGYSVQFKLGKRGPANAFIFNDPGASYTAKRKTPMLEFHVSRAARDRYQFDQTLFQFNGNAVFANPQAARVFAQAMNDLRDVARYPDRTVRAGDLNAMGLIDELSHLAIKLYDDEMRKRGHIPTEQRIFSRALDYASQALGPHVVHAALQRFAQEFPPVAVYQDRQTAADYLAMNSVDALEEQLMLWLENANPAFQAFNELFDDASLKEQTAYRLVMNAVNEFFDQQPKFGPDNQTLIELLRAPALASPDSLEGQLQFIQQRWSPYFGQAFGRFVTQLLTSLDLIREDEKAAVSFGGGPGPSLVPTFEDLGGVYAAPSGDITVVEYEAFTPDREWMPRLVLMAKNSYVWLDQLSRKYQHAITTLDQVPDEELEQLAEWGFTGLWLIGLWERSTASQRIKQMMGAEDAVASAYSLYDYVIAQDLGGEAALNNLKARAWQRGIRLASDMVPNHMGIDSKWVMERPEYFLSLDYPPYPAYTFKGPDLSNDERVGIFIEDHYYDKSDAAVVFKRVDKWTGDARYIYHGNDGTAIPWNDTAQINYLSADAREAVIHTILHVARQFSVIRFDAAMTLAKRHVRRLWFPEPGAGGAIPSRAGHGMTAEEFDALMPNEFWREVVDRAAVEAPDTLLLAEAFWMLEGYFVRTLGMHRVYNSAFMNMLRDEKNDEYRQLIKNTIEFDPEILRRYVNFQNNPDEKTAVEQFGKGDKYFGVCTLMCTMPGLPMFGHGQVEGYTEKYGMEFRYPKLWESPDEDLVARHERDIFPLLKKRYLFAGVDQFRLFDFFTADGGVNEDVFAYSNRHGDERALVLYHNKFATALGWIRASAAYVVKQGDNKSLTQSMLGESLGLHNDEARFAIFRDLVSGLEHIRSSRELCEHGMYVELEAYKCHVFMDIREVMNDAEHPYAEINARLNGRGVPSIDKELEIVRLTPITHAYRRLVNADWLKRMTDVGVRTSDMGRAQLLDEAEAHAIALIDGIKRHTSGSGVETQIVRELRDDLEVRARAAVPKDEMLFATVLGWLLTRRLGEVAPTSANDGEATSRMWLTDWRLGDVLQDAFRSFGMDDYQSWQAVMQVKLMMTHRGLFDRIASAESLTDDSTTSNSKLQTFFNDPDAKALLQVNQHDGATYFNKQAFESLITALHAAATFERVDDRSATAQRSARDVNAVRVEAKELIDAAERAEYQIEQLLKPKTQTTIA